MSCGILHFAEEIVYAYKAVADWMLTLVLWIFQFVIPTDNVGLRGHKLSDLFVDKAWK